MIHLMPFLKPRSRMERTWSKRLESVNLWASIGDTHSNLHYDSKHGLLVAAGLRKTQHGLDFMRHPRMSH